ncbi:MAG: baseplate J/gp47 family protein [Chloroflexi bacterium]|nr:baseplate J/gp47 family protein [Chloroflexota bacterium]
MRSIEVIHLSRRDTIDTAAELLWHTTPGAQVWMRIPWRHPLGLKLINLKRLQRVAEDAGVDLRLISRHYGTRSLAREAGIPAYSAGPWRLRAYREARREAARDLRQRVRRYRGRLGFCWEHRPKHVGLGAALLAFIVIAMLLATLGAVAVALVPGAEVVLEPVAEPVSAQAMVTADSTYRDIDYGRAIIPGRLTQVIVEGEGSTPASGRLDVPDEHASGQVVFANRTNEPVLIPKGTIVRTTSGLNVRFYTLADVELPGELYAHRRVAIVALEPGPAGNVRALTIKAVEGEVANRVEVINDAPTSGGTIRRVPIVAQADFERLPGQLIVDLQAQSYQQLVQELQPGEFIPAESVDVRIMEQHFNQVLDERSDVLSMRMKVVARALVVDGRALEEFAEALLVQGGRERELIPDSLQIDRGNIVVDDSQVAYGVKRATFQIRARGVVTSRIDKERVKQALRGKSVQEAKVWLMREFTLRSEPRITMVPDWWERMPYLPARLDLIVSSGAT